MVYSPPGNKPFLGPKECLAPQANAIVASPEQTAPGVNTPWERDSAQVQVVAAVIAAVFAVVSILKLTRQDLSRNWTLTMSKSSLGEDQTAPVEYTTNRLEAEGHTKGLSYYGYRDHTAESRELQSLQHPEQGPAVYLCDEKDTLGGRQVDPRYIKHGGAPKRLLYDTFRDYELLLLVDGSARHDFHSCRQLTTQMAEFQRQLGPAKGPTQPDAPGEAGSSS
ncbi:hypothetical protein Tco_0552136 [Tanacetum coccineum]